MNRREEQFGPAYMNMFAVEIHSLAKQQPPPDLGKFCRGFVTLAMIKEHAVACQFLGIAACDQVKQRTSVRETVKRGGLAGGNGRRCHTGAQGDKKLQPLCHRDHRRRHQPRIFTRSPRRDQHTGIAQTIRRLRNLLQITVINRT